MDKIPRVCLLNELSERLGAAQRQREGAAFFHRNTESIQTAARLFQPGLSSTVRTNMQLFFTVLNSATLESSLGKLIT